MIAGTHHPKGRQPFLIVRSLAFCMILLLVTMRLGSLTEEALVTPVEDAIFGNAFIGDDSNNPQSNSQLVKVKGQLDLIIPLGTIPVKVHAPICVAMPEHIQRFSSREGVFEIFIPPECLA